jgi:hypothetical protein
MGIIVLISGLYMVNTGDFILVPIEEFGLFETLTIGQAFEQPTLTQPIVTEGAVMKSSLEPAQKILYVNKIPLYGPMFSSFIPINYNDMKTFSGKFGPYNVDPRKHIEVKLCTFPKSFPDMLNCETVELNYANGYVQFARGYKYDEFIARQALKNYGALYFIVSPIYGNIAQSPTAMIKVIEHD